MITRTSLATVVFVCGLMGAGLGGCTFSAERQSAEPQFVVDLDQDQMGNIVSILEDKYRVRIGFEDLDYRQESDSITLGDLERKLQVVAKTRPLSPKEQEWSRLVQQNLRQGVSRESLFDVNFWRRSGRFSASTMDDLLDKLVKDGPYQWAKQNGAYYIRPKASSVLDFPVSLDVADKSLPDVAIAITAQAPGREEFIYGESHIGPDNASNHNVRIKRLVLNKVPASDALCRVVEAANPTMCWELAGYQGGRMLGFTPQRMPDPDPQGTAFAEVTPENIRVVEAEAFHDALEDAMRKTEGRDVHYEGRLGQVGVFGQEGGLRSPRTGANQWQVCARPISDEPQLVECVDVTLIGMIRDVQNHISYEMNVLVGDTGSEAFLKETLDALRTLGKVNLVHYEKTERDPAKPGNGAGSAREK